MLTHGNLLANLEQCQAHPGRAQDADDVVLRRAALLPHLRAQRGARAHASSPAPRCSPSSASTRSRGIETHRQPRRHRDQRRARRCGRRGRRCPASPAGRVRHGAPRHLGRRPARSRRCSARWPSASASTISEGYGLTEASPVVSSGHGLDAPEGSIGVPAARPARCGSSTPTARTRSSATPARCGCRAPTCSPATGRTRRPPPSALTADGWLRTGDVAVVDDDGFLFLVDRAKDLIIVSGFNVYPAEVEEVIAEHPAVAQVAVIGVPHPHSGEAVKAYVVVARRAARGGGRHHRPLRGAPGPIQVPAEGDVRRRDPAERHRQGAPQAPPVALVRSCTVCEHVNKRR